VVLQEGSWPGLCPVLAYFPGHPMSRGGLVVLFAHSVPRVSSESGSALHQLGRLFGDRDGWCVGVATQWGGHDRGVDDPKSLDAAHSQLRVDHGPFMGAHRAGPGREAGQRLASRDIQQGLCSGEQRVEVRRVLVEAEVDLRFRGQVNAGELEPSAAARVIRVTATLNPAIGTGRRALSW
jgi:hypothetical protein